MSGDMAVYGLTGVVAVENFSAFFGGKIAFVLNNPMWITHKKPSDSTDMWRT